MARVLVVDHERVVRRSLTQTLGESGYDVKEAATGRAGLDIASQEPFDLILLDVDLPGMDGWQILAKLKEDPHTRGIPVIMLNSFPSVDNEATGMRLGAAHILAKPWHSETLAITVRVVLREAENAVEEENHAARPAASESRKIIDTGGKLIPLERLMGGGISTGTLTLLEGVSEGGKSVICQYFTYGAISLGRDVAYFSSEHTADSLNDQMSSIGLGVSRAQRDDRLCMYPLPRPSARDDPEKLLTALLADIEHLPDDRGFTILDSVSNLVELSQDRAVMGFFSSCHRLCEEGRTIVVVARSSAFDPNLLGRLHGLCNTHLCISGEMVMGKSVKILEAPKINNADRRTDNRFSFQVEPEVGIKIIPMSRVKG